MQDFKELERLKKPEVLERVERAEARWCGERSFVADDVTCPIPPPSVLPRVPQTDSLRGLERTDGHEDRSNF